jgi:hypothetical protein
MKDAHVNIKSFQNIVAFKILYLQAVENRIFQYLEKPGQL